MPRTYDSKDPTEKQRRHEYYEKRKPYIKAKIRERRKLKPFVGPARRKILQGRDYLETYNYLLTLQEGKCAICSRPAMDFKTRLDMDHNHKTGKIRGLLCAPCNRRLGFVEKYSAAIVRYLKREPPTIP